LQDLTTIVVLTVGKDNSQFDSQFTYKRACDSHQNMHITHSYFRNSHFTRGQ